MRKARSFADGAVHHIVVDPAARLSVAGANRPGILPLASTSCTATTKLGHQRNRHARPVEDRLVGEKLHENITRERIDLPFNDAVSRVSSNRPLERRI